MRITERRLRRIIRSVITESHKQNIIEEGKKWDAIKSGAKKIVKKAYQGAGLGALILQTLAPSPADAQPLHYKKMQSEIQDIEDKSDMMDIAHAIVALTKYYRESADVPDTVLDEIEEAQKIINERLPTVAEYLEKLSKNPSHRTDQLGGFDSTSEVLDFDSDMRYRAINKQVLEYAKRKFDGEHVIVKKYINPKDEVTKKEAKFFEMYKKNRERVYKAKQNQLKTTKMKSPEVLKSWESFKPFNKGGIFVYYPFGLDGEPRFYDGEDWSDRKWIKLFQGNITRAKAEENLDGDQFGRKVEI